MSAAGRMQGSSARGDRGPLGLPHVHHRLTDSTNERAKELGAEGAPHGTLVTAEGQTAGRGRQGRRWEAPPGRALLASVVIRPLDEGDAVLPLAVAVAVCEACEQTAPVSCAIKWPNDVWIDRRKVAGILVEGRPQEGWAVVGVGVNITTSAQELPPEVRETGTSLVLASGVAGQAAALSVQSLLGPLLRALGERLEEPPDRVLEAWRARDALAGRPVAWEGGHGTAAGVDGRGALLVDTAEGRAALDAGEVHLASGGAPHERCGHGPGIV